MEHTDSIVSTPYDDVFRTMVNDCRSLLLPVMKEVFGIEYTRREKIEFQPNEHFFKSTGWKEQKGNHRQQL